MYTYIGEFRGNIVDVLTLRVTINHLKAQNMEVKHGILMQATVPTRISATGTIARSLFSFAYQKCFGKKVD
jgi:hypothetical protein